jgi:hypothetical protein
MECFLIQDYPEFQNSPFLEKGNQRCCARAGLKNSERTGIATMKG